MGSTNVLRRMALIAALLGSFGVGGQWAAAQTAPSAPAPAGTAPAAPATPTPPAPPAPAQGAPVTPAPAAPSAPAATSPATPPAAATQAAPPPAATQAPPPPAATQAAPAPDAAPTEANPADKAGPVDRTSPDTSISQTLELQPRPVIMLSGQATWDEGFKSLNDSFTTLNHALEKINGHPNGNPMAVFTETDDSGFKFTAMVPVENTPEGKPDIPQNVSFGMSPGGKVMRFQHRSAYDDIDSTYEAITAYLDEKGLEAKNMFAEEYLHRTKSSDDPSLEVDIDVFLK